MRIWKSSLLIIGLCVLVLSSMTAVAETESDPQGDVWHFLWPYWQEQTVDNQPNIDIKEIKADVVGDQITLSMTLHPGGTFTRGDNSHIVYMMFYNTSDAYYMMTYSDTIDIEPIGSALGLSLEGTTLPSTAEVTVVGDTISATMDKVGNDTTAVSFHGLAWMYEEYYAEQLTHDSWHDWVGDYDWNPELDPETGGDDTGGDDTGGDDTGTDAPTGTPGFETLAVIAALGVAFIILRRRK